MKLRVVLISVFALMVAGVSSAQVPNDLCDNAIFVPMPMSFPTQDTDLATSSPSDPAPTCTTPGDGVWFYFMPQVSGETRINTCGSTYPTVPAIQLYWMDPGGPACDSAYMVPETNGCDSGQSFYCAGGAAITVTVNAGNTYYLHVFDPAAPPSTADALRTGGSLSLNLDGAVPAELVKVGID